MSEAKTFIRTKGVWKTNRSHWNMDVIKSHRQELRVSSLAVV